MLLEIIRILSEFIFDLSCWSKLELTLFYYYISVALSMCVAQTATKGGLDQVSIDDFWVRLTPTEGEGVEPEQPRLRRRGAESLIQGFMVLANWTVVSLPIKGLYESHAVAYTLALANTTPVSRQKVLCRMIVMHYFQAEESEEPLQQERNENTTFLFGTSILAHTSGCTLHLWARWKTLWF